MASEARSFNEPNGQCRNVRLASSDSTASAVLRLQEIPATLEDLLMARLDRMASNREVVQLAATLGREFSYGLLRAGAAALIPCVA